MENDKNSLSKTRLGIVYSQILRPDMRVWGGLVLYKGNTPIDESRHAVFPGAGFEYQPEFGGTFDLAWKPDVDFVSLNELYHRYYMLSENARGSVVENTANLKLGYHREIDPTLKAGISLGYRNDRHQPFPAYIVSSSVDIPDEGWTIITRTNKSWECDIEAEKNLPWNIDLMTDLTFRHSRTNGFGFGDHASFIPPVEAKVSTLVPIWKVQILNDIAWISRTPINFSGDLERPAYAKWDISGAYWLSRNIKTTLGVDNLLNQYYYDIPRYDAPPLTVYLQVQFRGN
jgi:hypothetical protein